MPLLRDQASAKSFNEINLTRHDDCCPLYLELLLHVATTSLQTGHRMDVGTTYLREEHRLRYDLGCSLSVLDRNADAFAQANAINFAHGGEPLQLKIDLVKIIGNALKYQVPRSGSSRRENPNRSFTLQLELRVRREAVLLQPDSARDLCDLGALLLGSPEQLEEGIHVYSRALQVRPFSRAKSKPQILSPA